MKEGKCKSSRCCCSWFSCKNQRQCKLKEIRDGTIVVLKSNIFSGFSPFVEWNWCVHSLLLECVICIGESLHFIYLTRLLNSNAIKIRSHQVYIFIGMRVCINFPLLTPHPPKLHQLIIMKIVWNLTLSRYKNRSWTSQSCIASGRAHPSLICDQ